MTTLRECGLLVLDCLGVSESDYRRSLLPRPWMLIPDRELSDDCWADLRSAISGQIPPSGAPFRRAVASLSSLELIAFLYALRRVPIDRGEDINLGKYWGPASEVLSPLRFDGNDQGAVNEAWLRLYRETGGALYEPPYGPARIKWPIVHSGLDSVSRRRMGHFITWYASLYGVPIRDVIEEATSSVDHFLDALLDWHHCRMYDELHMARCIDESNDESEQLALADAVRQVLRRQGDVIIESLRKGGATNAVHRDSSWTSLIERPRCRVRFDRNSGAVQLLISCTIPAGQSYLDATVDSTVFKLHHTASRADRKVYRDVPMGLSRPYWPRQIQLEVSADGIERMLTKRLPRCPFADSGDRGVMVCDRDGIQLDKPLISDDLVTLVGSKAQLELDDVAAVFAFAPDSILTHDISGISWVTASVRALDVRTQLDKEKIQRFVDSTGSRVELEVPPPARFDIVGRRAWVNARAPLLRGQEIYVRVHSVQVDARIDLVHMQGSRERILASVDLPAGGADSWLQVPSEDAEVGAIVLRSNHGWRSRATPIAPAPTVDLGQWTPIDLQADIIGEMSGHSGADGLAVGMSIRSVSGSPVLLLNDWGQLVAEAATNEHGEAWNADLSAANVGSSVKAVDWIGDQSTDVVGRDPYVSRGTFQLRNGMLSFIVRIPPGTSMDDSSNWAAYLVDDGVVPDAVQIPRLDAVRDQDIDGVYARFEGTAPALDKEHRWAWAIATYAEGGKHELQAVQSLRREPGEIALTNKDLNAAFARPGVSTAADVARLVERRTKPVFVTPSLGSRLGAATLAQIAGDHTMAMFDLFFGQPDLVNAVAEFGSAPTLSKSLNVSLEPEGFSDQSDASELDLDGAPEVTLISLTPLISGLVGQVSVPLSWGDDEIAWAELQWTGQHFILPSSCNFVGCSHCGGIFPDNVVWELHRDQQRRCSDGQPEDLDADLKLTPRIHWALAIPAFFDALTSNDQAMRVHQKATFANMSERLDTGAISPAEATEILMLARVIANVLTELPVGGAQVSPVAVSAMRQFARHPLARRNAAFALFHYPMSILCPKGAI